MPRSRRLLSSGLLAFLLVFVIWAGVNAQSIEDWYRLRGYSLPANIASIAKDDAMTPKAMRILAVTRPTLESNGQAFQSACAQNEQTIVLGCYHSGLSFLSGDSSLFVFDVRDARLNGVQQVTTAHEMLHAAYDHLSTKQKNDVNAMLTDFFNNGLKDQRIIDTINAYKKTEPNDVLNEMHSVLGTEASALPAGLESYYKQYFTSRQAVTTFANNYEDEFTSRDNQIKADDEKLAQMRQTIQSEEAQLQTQLASLEADRASIERSNDQTAVNNYNSRVTSYNAGVRRLQNDIAAYNALVEERNSIASELRSLQQSLDSRFTTQPAQ